MPNALVSEKSPYLLQHADNPVNWLPWGEAAFAKARGEQKPIFLSIGYATCHWCHVMAHESFEDEDVAAVLNASFVSIKVDREERPDVDKVYMTYVQAMTGHGGWPLSAWLTPDLLPFFGGTYFPPEDRGGRAGFVSILRAIAKGWAENRDQLVAEGDRVIAALREHARESRTESSELSAASGDAGSASQLSALGSGLLETGQAAFEKCFHYFYEAFDPQNAGFGGAPKFPRASNLNFLFRIAALQGATSEVGAEAIKLATSTCESMARGGIHDHVGGGFHRYSVDERWFVPHFEKMLYDQAQIAINALEAKQATGDERFAWLAHDVFGYVLRDLQHPQGGFYSAEDADSAPSEAAQNTHDQPTGGGAKAKNEEGAFYVWTQAEIAAVLGDDAPLFCAHFGIAENGNVPPELDPHGELAGKNILMQRQPLAATARAFQLDLQQANDRLLGALKKLRDVRERRLRPLLDDKIITAWNGLMISALAKAHQVLGDATVEVSSSMVGTPLRGVRGRLSEPSLPSSSYYLHAATRAAAFVERELYDAERGVLFRSWREGRGTVEGFAEDYALMIQALLDLYEASFEIHWLRWAERLQATMDARFWDAERGGYFNSQANDPHIVLRLKEDYDGAEPAASSVAAMNLLRLSVVLGSERQTDSASATDESYRMRGLRCLAAFQHQWTKTPQALPQMLCALELALDAPRHVVIAGDPLASDFRALVAVVHEQLGPRRALLAADAGEGQRWLATRAPWMAEMKPIHGRAAAYVCEEYACQAPVTTPEDLRRTLSGS
jgi:uncharacterized protein YyaL (SSP411 family)